jgi:hypothetical protein
MSHFCVKAQKLCKKQYFFFASHPISENCATFTRVCLNFSIIESIGMQLASCQENETLIANYFGYEYHWGAH